MQIYRSTKHNIVYGCCSGVKSIVYGTLYEYRIIQFITPYSKLFPYFHYFRNWFVYITTGNDISVGYLVSGFEHANTVTWLVETKTNIIHVVILNIEIEQFWFLNA